ncbi:dystroglycan-like [Dorcoceras hygrometricum]|uniref:Dystroglycan-like n=1 Tax=Dorcoceras hygrometricum TaxID=472368 RepID=A0A2Z7DE33_9LAMI|nr:dystroglycan-like [Dorcoceras hygrometricum]
MASSLISNSHHVDFDSVFGMDDATITQMFELLIATGLKDFLGCPAVYYEAALIEFFENGSVREDGMVVSTIRGITVEISEGMFATAFGLPTEGLTDVSDVPKDLVFDARSLFSESEEQVGSFDAVTRERFMIMTAITCDVKINWGSLLFGVLKAMVMPGSRQAKGYTIQICVVLSKVPGLELGESNPFPIHSALTERTVHRFIHINEQIGMEKAAGSTPVKKTVKKPVSKKRSAASETEVAPIAKKKRTTKGKPAAMALEAVPLQTIEPTADVPAAQPPVPTRKSRKRRLVLEQEDDLVVDEPVEESATGVQETSTDVPVSEEQPAADQDDIIEQILIQLDTAAATQGDKIETWFDRAFDEELERQDSEEEIVFDVAKTGEEASGNKHHTEELMSLDDLLIQISEDTMLPSVTVAEITKIRLGESINIQEVQDRDVYYASLPRISIHDKGKEPLVEDEPVKGNPARESVELICGDVEFLVRLRDQVVVVDIQSIQEFESASSDGSTVYRWSPSPILQKDDSFDQENLYFVESPESPPRPLLSQDSTSSSSDSQMNFDDTDTAAPAPPTISQPGFSTVSPDITEAIHQLRTSLDQISNQDNGAALKDVILLHLHDIEKKFTTRLDAQDRWFGTLRKDSNDQRNLLSLEIKSSQRQINTQIAAATLDQIDMQSEVKELNAKVDAMATNLEILRRNAEATKEAISHQLLEFQAKIAADILSLSIQIGKLVDHIRGGDAKKGEIGSSSRRPPPVRVELRPLPTPANQGESSSGHGRVLSVEEAAEMVREADIQAMDVFSVWKRLRKWFERQIYGKEKGKGKRD